MTRPPGPGKASPLMMPVERRPAIVRAPPPARPGFFVASAVPRRGWPDAVVWPDTGVMLSMGVSPELPARFRDHYRGRTRVATNVAREVRALSEATSPVDDRAYRRNEAAGVAVRGFLLGGASLPTYDVAEEDLTAVDDVAALLADLSGDTSKRHGGEAACIVLFRQAAVAAPGRHLLLTNDGSASTVAANAGLPSRHAADVLAELACADAALDPATCWRHHQDAVTFSGIPANARPRDKEAFRCDVAPDGACPRCDGPGTSPAVSP